MVEHNQVVPMIDLEQIDQITDAPLDHGCVYHKSIVPWEVSLYFGSVVGGFNSPQSYSNLWGRYFSYSNPAQAGS